MAVFIPHLIIGLVVWTLTSGFVAGFRLAPAWLVPSALGLLQAVAIAIHLQDMDVVGEPVEQRAREPFRAAAPLTQYCAAVYRRRLDQRSSANVAISS